MKVLQTRKSRNHEEKIFKYDKQVDNDYHSNNNF